MVEVLFNGSAGRIQGKIHVQPDECAPIVLLLPSHPQHGGNMDSKIIYHLYKVFANAGFTVLRINYRGVGKSTGAANGADGELSDAATAVDWLQNQYPAVRNFWIAGFSFGSWIGMQLLMRRPEISGFVAISPPAHLYDFSFLSPCPVPGIVIQGEADTIVPSGSVDNLMSKMRVHKGVTVEYKKIPGANHFFDDHSIILNKLIAEYLKNIQMKKIASHVSA